MDLRYLCRISFGWSIVFLLAACTSEQDEQDINRKVISEISVFNSADTLTNFKKSEGVFGFDSNNRPMVATSCPPPPPPDDGGGDVGIGTENPPPPPPPPPTCEAGFEFNTEQERCLPLCQADQVFAQGQCYDRERECPVANGQGTETWLANSYDECRPRTCDEGFELVNEKCQSSCRENETLVNGKCQIARCEDGYVLADNKCVIECQEDEVFHRGQCKPRERECPIAGGEGKQKWKRLLKRYGWCRVVDCHDGFVQRGNACIEDEQDNDADPLIVDTGATTDAEAQGIQLTSQIDGILFDILGRNSLPSPHDKKRISWTSSGRYKWVVMPDVYGQVNGIDQMFGDNTLGPDNQFAVDGFDALGKYDVDSNRKIDGDDPIYRSLGLWADTNGNGQVDLGELESLRQARISSIDLAFDPNFYEVDKYGNKTTFKSVVNYFNGQKNLIFDLWFNYQEPDSPVVCP